MLSNNRLKTESAGDKQEKMRKEVIGSDYFFHVFYVTLNNSESKKRVISGVQGTQSEGKGLSPENNNGVDDVKQPHLTDNNKPTMENIPANKGMGLDNSLASWPQPDS